MKLQDHGEFVLQLSTLDKIEKFLL